MSSGQKSLMWDTSQEAFLLATVILGLVAIVGCIGNGFVVTVVTILRRRGHKSSVQLFLLHLAISDLMVCLLCIPLTIFSNFHYPTQYSSMDDGICKLSRFVQYLAPTISIALLTTISIDRYLSLARPMASIAFRPRFLTPCWLIPLAWLYSILQFIPTFYFADVQSIILEGNKTVYYCTTVPNNTSSGIAYLMFLSVASFALPLLTMSILYYKVARVVWRRQRNLSITSTISGHTANLKVLVQSRKRVTRVLLTVVLVFLICWAPFVIYCGFIERELRGFPNPMDGARLGMYGLGLANSMCNPFIYFFNVGGKRTDAVRDLYLQITAGRKRRASSTSSQRGERKISNISQLSSLKKAAELKGAMEDQTKDSNQGNKNHVTDYEIWNHIEEMWLPFSVWPPFKDLRESVL